ncbi:hypothetical protein BGZ73_007841 [Actinomortierella ambigua]|nr:hypothetical protein BGZ73_007841 [Actinomortierella ambigua]
MLQCRTRQLAFRAFTIAKTRDSNSAQQPSALVSGAADTATASTAFPSPFIASGSRTKEANTDIAPRQPSSNTATRTSSDTTALQSSNGFDEKHQEKLQSRSRGAGFKITLGDRTVSTPTTSTSENPEAGGSIAQERRRSPRKHPIPTTDAGNLTSTATLAGRSISSTTDSVPPSNATLGRQTQWGRGGKASSSIQRPVPADIRPSSAAVGVAQKRGTRKEEEDDDDRITADYPFGAQEEHSMWTDHDFADVGSPPADFEDNHPWQPETNNSDTDDFDPTQPFIRKRGVSKPLPTTPTKKRRLDQAQVVPTSPSARRSRDDIQARRMPVTDNATAVGGTSNQENESRQDVSSKAGKQLARPFEKSSRKQTGSVAEPKARATTTTTASESVVPSSPVTRSKSKSTLVQTQLSVVRPAASDPRTRAATLQYTVPEFDEDHEIFEAPARANKDKGVAARRATRKNKDKGKRKDKAMSRAGGKGKGKGKRRDGESTSDDDNNSSDGDYGRPVKVYRQLQIQCIKLLGSSTTASRPAQLSNLDKAKQASVVGEENPERGQENAEPTPALTQGVLQWETAPLSEMDVIAEAVRAVADQFIDSIQDEATARELGVFRANLETLLIEQVDLQDDHALLCSSVKKASRLKKELRARLLAAQRQHQAAKEQLERVRADFERQERVRRRVEETHLFLNNLETMCSSMQQMDVADDIESSSATTTTSLENHGAPLKLQSLVATVAARSGAGGGSGSQGSSVISKLREFNRILETVDQAVRAYQPDEAADLEDSEV